MRNIDGISRLPSAFAFLLLLLLCACTREERGRPPVDGMITLKLKVSLPRDERPVPVQLSRATSPGSAEESRVSTLRLFVFKSNENKLEKYQSVSILPDGTSNDPSWNPAEKAMHVVVSPGPKRVYCIANWADTPTAEMPEISDQTVTDTLSLINKTRLHGTDALVNPPVMSGRLALTLVGNEQNLSVPLVRQVARVEIFPMLSAELKALGVDVKIEGVKFARVPATSFVFEQKSPTNIAGSLEQSAFAGTTFSVTAAKPEDAVKYPVDYYAPEHFAASEAATTAMIIKTSYNGRTIYYAVPLGEPSSGAAPSYAVRRNHCYNYYLTIRGIGSPTVATRSLAAPAYANIHLERLEVEAP